MPKPTTARASPVRDAKQSQCVTDFAALVRSVPGDYFHLRTCPTPLKPAECGYARAVYDSRGRLALRTSIAKVRRWLNAGWIEQLDEDAKRGREFIVTDKGHAAAKTARAVA